MTILPKIKNLLDEKGLNDVLLTGGGIIPEQDIKKLKEMGVGDLFTPGASTKDIAKYIKEWREENPRKF
jgi:methylmalonyl-CoA mutase C-terminal domain/subunit